MGNIVELSCPTITPYAVLEASGHVGEFSDFMTNCNSCEEASRADTILEPHHPQPRFSHKIGFATITQRY